ncbi:MYXO-CTERM sorting domain-containing protein [Ideonella sp. A 288]|uniref:MYXO-CTERM sorting domain-containing protein n=1 Tax=Ideonella sp. A 288 TaxID=1962181 RepID=UPI000B4BA623|nr:MYXO-CTERM sorting domain-containing protein [Ideonella sp. A 288]
MMKFLAKVLALAALSLQVHATVIGSAYTPLGGNQWSVAFEVTNDGAPASIGGFTVYFDEALFSGLSVLDSPAGWDSLVAQPDAALPAAGFLDALVLDDADQLLDGDVLGGFRVAFTYLGAAAPGALPFEIVDRSFEVRGSGLTVPSVVGSQPVPEPPMAALVAVALAGLAWGRRRR